VIRNNRIGVCGVRQNIDGKLYALNYGKLIAQNIDPIEKKPLYHFYPGSTAYSIATAGCNFQCAYCQNYHISQLPVLENLIIGREVATSDVVEQALKGGCKSIAYTYTEPTIFYEFACDTAKLARENGLKNIFITNGYITPEALKTIAPYLDAANVDLKSFSNTFYKRICKAKLPPVLNTLRLLKELGIWVEVTTLVIPTLNDSRRELQSIADFIMTLGAETPWHISAFYPAYKLSQLPPTSREALYGARVIGLAAGLRHVYTGNIADPETETTYCHNCGNAVIRRRAHMMVENLLFHGCCPYCNEEMDGVGFYSNHKNGLPLKKEYDRVMKVLIATQGSTLDSAVAKRFGHAPHYLLIDLATMRVEAIDNQEHDDTHAIVPQAAKDGVKVLITGNIGPNAFALARSLNLQVALARRMSAKEALKSLQKGELEMLNSPTLKRSVHEQARRP
jgi:pyruvate formate lyase activating enzyme